MAKITHTGMKNLSTTSYAVLGLLALRPWSTYELTRQMKRGLHYFWPRAESGVYEEPKKLVAYGLARAEVSHVGRRPRTVYTITPEGRAALHDWLGRETAPAQLAVEALVKIWFGELGTKADLQGVIEAIRRDAEATLAHVAGVATEYLGADPPFPGRIHVNTLVLKFVYDYARTVRQWTDWAEEQVAGWSGVTKDEGADAAWDILREAAAQVSHKPNSVTKRSRQPRFRSDAR